jgi:nucleoside-diphosphate-sugar epimerase
LNELVRLVGQVQGVEVSIYRFPWMFPAYLAAWSMEIVSRPLRIEPPIFRRRLTWFTTNRCWRTSKAEADLGYAPKVGLAEGLRKTLEWYRAEGLL